MTLPLNRHHFAGPSPFLKLRKVQTISIWGDGKVRGNVENILYLIGNRRLHHRFVHVPMALLNTFSTAREMIFFLKRQTTRIMLVAKLAVRAKEGDES